MSCRTCGSKYETGAAVTTQALDAMGLISAIKAAASPTWRSMEAEEEDVSSFTSNDDEDAAEDDHHKVLPGYMDLNEILAEEKEHIDENHVHRGCKGDQRFSLAFSGGGLRASAFQLGVLWRLAREGRLKDVEYIAGTSGGTWAASALVSHIVAEGQPPAGCNMDAWYLGIVAKTICRIQSNTPYLVRDLGKAAYNFPTDGSSHLPRIFDLPILALTVVGTIISKLALTYFLAVTPMVEVVVVIFGPSLRRCLCNPQKEPIRAFFVERVWVVYCSVCAFLLVLFAILSLTQGIIYTCCKKTVNKHPQVVLFLHSSVKLALRTFLWIVFQMVCAMLALELTAKEPDSVKSRLDNCITYLQHVQQSQKVDCGDIPLFEGAPWYGNATLLIGQLMAQAGETESAIGPVPLVQFNKTTIVTFAVRFLIGIQILSLIIRPIFKQAWIYTLGLVGPTLYTVAVIIWTAHRNFPMAKEYLESEYQPERYTPAMVIFMLAIPLFTPISKIAHVFYRLSLQHAFFAQGKDLDWGQIKSNPFCPLVLFVGTVNDYAHYERHDHKDGQVSDIFMSPLFMGGTQLNYVRSPQYQSMAMCMTVSAAAPDSAALGIQNQNRFRFWLEILNLCVGNLLAFEPQDPRELHRDSWVWKLKKRLRKYGLYVNHTLSKSAFKVGLLLEIVAALALCGHLLHNKTQCATSRTISLTAFILGYIILALSFFSYARGLDFLMYSMILRGFHQAPPTNLLQARPPTLLYVTDGMVIDNTGVIQLLRRRCKKILLVYGGGGKNHLHFLEKIAEVAWEERIASFYNLSDSRTDYRDALQEFLDDDDIKRVCLGILYGTKGDPLGQTEGRLVVVKCREQKVLKEQHVQPLLSEEEITDTKDEFDWESSDDSLADLNATDLGGCWCDWCHSHGFNWCCHRFPYAATSNQCLTPRFVSGLCRLGYQLSAGASDALFSFR